MECVEYHDVPIEESGIFREGQTQVWFKDLVRDVYSVCCQDNDNSSGRSRYMNYRQESRQG